MSKYLNHYLRSDLKLENLVLIRNYFLKSSWWWRREMLKVEVFIGFFRNIPRLDLTIIKSKLRFIQTNLLFEENAWLRFMSLWHFLITYLFQILPPSKLKQKFREINYLTNKSLCESVSRNIFPVRVILCFFYTLLSQKIREINYLFH